MSQLRSRSSHSRSCHLSCEQLSVFQESRSSSACRLSIGRPEWFYWEDSQCQYVKLRQGEQRREAAHP